MSTMETKPSAAPMAVETKEKKGVLYIGIDLGTSRTAIAASNGVRESSFSVVGYPKDVVSRKLLQKDVLFGEEAMKRRLSLHFYRPLEKGVIKFSDDGTPANVAEAQANMKAAADLVRHAISLAQPRKDELVYAVIGCPAQGSIRNKRAIIDAARNVVDSVMICSEPFAVAYGLDRLDDVLVIDIGAGTTDLCRMHGTMPEEGDQITLPFAGDFVDQELATNLKKDCPGADFSLNMVREIKEKYSFVGEAADPCVVELPVAGKPTRFDVTNSVRNACRKIIPPIVESLGKLVATFDPEFQSRLKNNVLIGGGGSQIKGLARAIEQEMHERLGEGRVIASEEPVYGGANGALKIAHDMPAEFWEQLR